MLYQGAPSKRPLPHADHGRGPRAELPTTVSRAHTVYSYRYVGVVMNPTYIVTVLDNGVLALRQRIELEVQFARELERLLGGAHRVAGASRAALSAEGLAAEANGWHAAFKQALQLLRERAGLPDLDFRVDPPGRADVLSPLGHDASTP